MPSFLQALVFLRQSDALGPFGGTAQQLWEGTGGAGTEMEVLHKTQLVLISSSASSPLTCP